MESSTIHNISRRRLIRLGAGLTARLGVVSVGAAALGETFATPAEAGATGSGQDGATNGRNVQAAVSDRPLATPALTSYNGWPIGTPGSVIGVQPYLVPGTSIYLSVKSGDVATVLIYLAQRFNREVEPLQADQVGGYEYRVDVNHPSWWSNHASGTAIDLNSELHPNGAKGTFGAGRMAAIRNIQAYFGDVIFWGGDYSGVTDEMHWEINVPPGDPRLPALASRIRAGVVVSFRALADNCYVTAERDGSAALIANRTQIGLWEQFDLLDQGGDFIALRAHANNRYVCADEAGSSPLIANRTAIGAWETFTLIHNADATVSFQALANGRYVTAEDRGAESLIANRTAIGPWEKFDLIGA